MVFPRQLGGWVCSARGAMCHGSMHDSDPVETHPPSGRMARLRRARPRSGRDSSAVANWPSTPPGGEDRKKGVDGLNKRRQRQDLGQGTNSGKKYAEGMITKIAIDA